MWNRSAKDAPPPWFSALAEDYPDIAEAWNDPLFEHARECGLLRPKNHEHEAFAALALMWVLVGGLVLTAPHLLREFLVIVVLSILPTLVFCGLAGLSYLRQPRRFRFLEDLSDPLWKEIPIDPARATRLMALHACFEKADVGKEMVPTGLAIGSILAGHLTQYIGWFALLIPVTCSVLMKIVQGIMRSVFLARDIRRGQMESRLLSAVHVLCTQAECMKIPKLSDDPTATQAEKEVMYHQVLFDFGQAHTSMLGNDERARTMKRIVDRALEGFEGLLRRWRHAGFEIRE